MRIPSGGGGGTLQDAYDAGGAGVAGQIEINVTGGPFDILSDLPNTSGIVNDGLGVPIGRRVAIIDTVAVWDAPGIAHLSFQQFGFETGAIRSDWVTSAGGTIGLTIFTRDGINPNEIRIATKIRASDDALLGAAIGVLVTQIHFALQDGGAATNVFDLVVDGASATFFRPRLNQGIGGTAGVYIGSPTLGFTTVYTRNVLADDSATSLTIGQAAIQLGFFGSAGAVEQTIQALTNNVTAGGSNDVIANFTDLTVYANDAAAIRNDIYQLARKVAQLEAALNVYNLTKH